MKHSTNPSGLRVRGKHALEPRAVRAAGAELLVLRPTHRSIAPGVAGNGGERRGQGKRRGDTGRKLENAIGKEDRPFHSSPTGKGRPGVP